MSSCKDLIKKLESLEIELECKKEEYKNTMEEMRHMYNLSKICSYKSDNLIYRIPIISYFMKNKKEKLLQMSDLYVEISKKNLIIANIISDTINIIQDHIEIIRNKISLHYRNKRIKRMTMPFRSINKIRQYFS